MDNPFKIDRLTYWVHHICKSIKTSKIDTLVVQFSMLRQMYNEILDDTQVELDVTAPSKLDLLNSLLLCEIVSVKSELAGCYVDNEINVEGDASFYMDNDSVDFWDVEITATNLNSHTIDNEDLEIESNDDIDNQLDEQIREMDWHTDGYNLSVQWPGNRSYIMNPDFDMLVGYLYNTDQAYESNDVYEWVAERVALRRKFYESDEYNMDKERSKFFAQFVDWSDASIETIDSPAKPMKKSPAELKGDKA
jgi:hypothetical protein